MLSFPHVRKTRVHQALTTALALVLLLLLNTGESGTPASSTNGPHSSPTTSPVRYVKRVVSSYLPLQVPSRPLDARSFEMGAQSAFALGEADITVSGIPWKKRETSFLRGTPGFMMLKNLYLYERCLYAITSDSASLPPVTRLLSGEEEPSGHRGPAKADRYQVISPEEANSLFGTRGDGIARLPGTTFFFNDSEKRGLYTHFYHLIVESFLGAWRVAVSSPEALTNDRLEADWQDRASSGNVYLLETIVLIDRANYVRDGGKSGPQAKAWNKFTGDVFLLPAPLDWFEPVRSSVLHRLGVAGNHAARAQGRRTITYLNHQLSSSGTKLSNSDHDALVGALKTLESDPAHKKKLDVYVVRPDTLSRRDLIQLLAKTDVLISTRCTQKDHQLWLRHGSAVFELMQPGHYTRDAELLSEGLYLHHHVVHADSIYNWNATEPPSYKQSNGANVVPVDAEFVLARVVDFLHQSPYVA